MAAAAQYIPPEQEDVQTFSTNCGAPFIDEAAKQAGGDASVDTAPVNTSDRSSLLSVIGRAIGVDITTITIPVGYNEPMSQITRMAEQLEYHHILNAAANSDDPVTRLLFLSAFVVACYSSTQRTTKPFNPLLGETFEFVDPQTDFNFVAEQVSHHPPVGVCHAHNALWEFFQDQLIKTKFTGNSLEVIPKGTAHVVLKPHQEHYHFSNITTIVHNLIIGSLWLEHVGQFTINVTDAADWNKKYNRRVVFKFKEAGWFSKGWRDIEAQVFDEDDTVRYKLTGKWNEQLIVSPVGDVPPGKPGSPPPFCHDGRHVVIWQNQTKKTSNPLHIERGWSEFTSRLVAIDDELRKVLPPSDSRLRPDRYALEYKDIKRASKFKHCLEENQRAQRRQRERDGTIHTPRYFESTTAEDGQTYWKFNGLYWKQRKERAEGKEPEQPVQQQQPQQPEPQQPATPSIGSNGADVSPADSPATTRIC